MEHWKVAIALTMSSNHDRILRDLMSSMVGANAAIGMMEKNWKAVAMAAGGVVTAFAGIKIIQEIDKVIEHGEKLVHQMELMKTAGMSAGDIQSSLNASYVNSAANLTITTSESLKNLRELRYAFGDIEKAKGVLDTVTRANTILNTINPKAGDQVWSMVKSLEEKGELGPNDTASFTSYMELMTKAIQASGGKVDPDKFFSAFKYSRTAKYGWDDEFIGQYLPRLIQEYSSGKSGGGGGASGGPGNALMSAFSEVVAGRTTKDALEQFMDLGLVNRSKVHIGKGGKITTDAGAFKYSEDMIANPYKYAQDIAPSVMRAAGGDKLKAMRESGAGEEEIKKESAAVEQRMIQLLAKMFPNRTAGDVMTNMILQGKVYKGEESPFEKDAALNKTPMSIADSYKELMTHDPIANMKAFTEQWDNMLEVLGAPGVEIKIKVLQTFTNGFNAISQWAEAHPEGAKIAVEAMIAVGVGLTALGASAVVAAAALLLPGGVVGAAITALGVAITALAAMNWDNVKYGLSSIWEGMKDVASKDWEQAKAAIAELQKLGGIAWDGIASGLGKLVDVLKVLYGVVSGPSADEIVKGLQKRQEEEKSHPGLWEKYFGGAKPGKSSFIDDGYSMPIQKAAYFGGGDGEAGSDPVIYLLSNQLKVQWDIYQDIHAIGSAMAAMLAGGMGGGGGSFMPASYGGEGYGSGSRSGGGYSGSGASTPGSILAPGSGATGGGVSGDGSVSVPGISVPGIAGSGGGKLEATAGRHPNTSMVDPRLNDIMAAAASALPEGYKVTVNEGYNTAGHVPGSMHHKAGSGALDLLITGPSGPISNRGDDSTGMYTQLAKNAYASMLKLYPELNGRLAWGGRFGTSRGSSVPDLMHFDLGGDRGHMRPPLGLLGGGSAALDGLSGNAYIKAIREPFAKELQDPKIREAVMGMMYGEGSDPAYVESLMNRAAYSHQTLRRALYGGFYGPVNRGEMPHNIEAAKRYSKEYEDTIAKVLAGSNTIKGATDQGMIGGPNGRWPGGRTVIKGEIFNDWGGGPGGHEGAAKWRENFMKRAIGKGPEQFGPPLPKLNDKIFDFRRGFGADIIRSYLGGKHPDSGQSFQDIIRSYTEKPLHNLNEKTGGIGKKTDEDKDIHTEIKLDGKVLAHHMQKHIVKNMAHPKQAPFADGRRGFWSPDHQTVTT